MVTWYILCKDPPFWLCDTLEEWDGVGDGKEAHEGGDICIAMADPCWYMAETNTIL